MAELSERDDVRSVLISRGRLPAGGDLCARLRGTPRCPRPSALTADLHTGIVRMVRMRALSWRCRATSPEEAFR